MLCILTWQDWTSMDGALRNPDINIERINVPADPRHYWRWRMHITLEELGSFIWQQIDGEKSILQIGELVQEAFGEKAEPLYERLAQYMKILYGKGFITFCKV